MDRVILLAIAGVLISLIVGQIFKGGLGLLRIISIALVVFLMVLLSARPGNSPAILPSLAKRLFSENTIPAEASGEVLAEEGSITPQSAGQSSSASQPSPSFSVDDTLVSQTSRSAQAAFSGARTTASSTQIDPPTPVRETMPQSTTQSTSSASTPDERVASPQVEPSSTSSQSPSYIPPSSASRPINALW